MPTCGTQTCQASDANPFDPVSEEATFNSQPDLQLQALLNLPVETADRRSKIRYPIELEVRFFISEGDSEVYRTGLTTNISSSGLLIRSTAVMREGSQLRIMIQWPWALDGRIPLQLVATGLVVRASQASFAVAVGNYQFRTMRQRIAPQAMHPAQLSI